MADIISCFHYSLNLDKCGKWNVLHNYSVPQIPLDTTYINCKAILKWNVCVPGGWYELLRSTTIFLCEIILFFSLSVKT